MHRQRQPREAGDHRRVGSARHVERLSDRTFMVAPPLRASEREPFNLIRRAARRKRVLIDLEHALAPLPTESRTRDEDFKRLAHVYEARDDRDNAIAQWQKAIAFTLTQPDGFDDDSRAAMHDEIERLQARRPPRWLHGHTDTDRERSSDINRER